MIFVISRWNIVVYDVFGAIVPWKVQLYNLLNQTRYIVRVASDKNRIATWNGKSMCGWFAFKRWQKNSQRLSFFGTEDTWNRLESSRIFGVSYKFNFSLECLSSYPSIQHYGSCVEHLCCLLVLLDSERKHFKVYKMSKILLIWSLISKSSISIVVVCTNIQWTIYVHLMLLVKTWCIIQGLSFR